MYCAQKNFFKFLIISLIALCQFSAFGQLEYESLFEKSQFDKINKKVLKDLTKKPSEPFLLYTAAVQNYLFLKDTVNLNPYIRTIPITTELKTDVLNLNS